MLTTTSVCEVVLGLPAGTGSGGIGRAVSGEGGTVSEPPEDGDCGVLFCPLFIDISGATGDWETGSKLTDWFFFPNKPEEIMAIVISEYIIQ